MFRPQNLNKYIQEAEERAKDGEITSEVVKVKSKDSFSLQFGKIFDILCTSTKSNYKSTKEKLLNDAKQNPSEIKQ